MIIVSMSDLHGYLPKPEEIPPCDIVCICGDTVPLDLQRNIASSISWFCLDFLPWTESLNCQKVIFIGGNHDFYLQGLGTMSNGREILKTILPGNNRAKYNKIVYLCDNSYTFEDIRFYGTPWIQDLSSWAFYKSEEDLEKIWSNIPKECDVLLTHQPPRLCECGTVLQRQSIFNALEDYGSEILANKLMERNIKYTFCGHVHSGNHVISEYKKDCRIVNVSLKDENYKLYYPPTLITL